jgi:hypothetical protein
MWRQNYQLNYIGVVHALDGNIQTKMALKIARLSKKAF